MIRAKGIRAFLVLAALTLALPTRASEAASGTVYGVLMIDQGVAFFYQAGTRTARPACATENRWAFNATTPAGQLMYATLLTALGTNRPVTIQGSGTCSVWGDTETVTHLQVWG